MNKFCGIISYMCGSVAIALLAIALMTGGGRQAWAVDCGCGPAPAVNSPTWIIWYSCFYSCNNGGGANGSNICHNFIAPSPCSAKNGNQAQCPGTTCSGPDTICSCFYNPMTMQCNCPG